MKICANCQRKYSDSLEYCLADGTVLSPMDDPQATLRIEARPTQSGVPAKRSLSLGVFVLAGLLVIAIVGVAAFIMLYFNWSKAAVDPAAKSPSVATANSVPSNNSASPKDEVTRKLEQMEAEIGMASLQSDVAALDRLLADDYRYTNSNHLSLNKKQTLYLYRSGQVRYEYLKTFDHKIDVSGDLNKGVVNGRGTHKVWFLGKFYDQPFSYSNSYEVRQGGWQLVNCQVWY